ncbi:hypothetical protein [Porphyromonas sp. COT-290 OH3588]|uniref:hypothetical protein n=1 Tax=Porphyromonas sp. COT-290 OH3588 TaxID=1515617 RepID=UPI000AF90EF8|nr:hypothetical protein [Porphyromonas sp. COT-290 OH3588]
MNKRFLKALVLGTMTFGAVASFVGCKDYDKDIQDINVRIDGLSKDSKQELDKLKSSLDAAVKSAQAKADKAEADAKAAHEAAQKGTAEAKTEAINKINEAKAEIQDLISKCATKEDLKGVIEKLEKLATKEEIKNFASKEDLGKLQDNLKKVEAALDKLSKNTPKKEDFDALKSGHQGLKKEFEDFKEKYEKFKNEDYEEFKLLMNLNIDLLVKQIASIQKELKVVAELKSKVAELEQSLTLLTGKVNGIDTKLTESVTKLEQLVETTKTELITALEEKAKTLKDEIDALASRIDALETKAEQNRLDIEANKGNIEENKKAIGENKKAIEQNAKDIDWLKKRITAFIGKHNLTSAVIVPEASYKGWPAIAWEKYPNTFREVKPNQNNGDVYHSEAFRYVIDEPETVTVKIRLNPATFDINQLGDISIVDAKIKELRNISIWKDGEAALPTVKSVEAGNDNGSPYVKVTLSDYRVGSDVDAAAGDKIHLIQFAIKTKGNNELEIPASEIRTNWVALHSTVNNEAQPYIYFDPAGKGVQETYEPTDQLLPRQRSVVEETADLPAHTLEVPYDKTTDLMSYVQAYLTKNASASRILKKQPNELTYEFEMPTEAYNRDGGVAGTVINQQRYGKITESGVFTPSYDGRDFTAVTQGKTPLVRIKLRMAGHLVALAYIKLKIVEDAKPQVADMFFKYWESVTPPQDGTYKTVFETIYIKGAKDPKAKFVSLPDWNNRNILAKIDENDKGMGINNFNTIYEFAGGVTIAEDNLDVIAGHSGMPVSKLLTGDEIKVSWTINGGTLVGVNANTFVLSHEAECLAPGEYRTAVKFVQRPDRLTKRLPKKVYVIFKVKVIDETTPSIEALAKEFDSYKLSALWLPNNTVQVKGVQVNNNMGYVPIIDTRNIFKPDGLANFFQNIANKAKHYQEVYGTGAVDISFVNPQDAEHFEIAILSDGYNVQVTRNPGADHRLKKLTDVAIKYTLQPEPNTCDNTRDIEICRINFRFNHAIDIKWGVGNLFNTEFKRFKDGELQIHDNRQQVEVELGNIYKLVELEKPDNILWEQLHRKSGEQILGRDLEISYEIVDNSVINDYVTNGILSLDPAGKKLIWNNNTTSGALQAPIKFNVALKIIYGDKQGNVDKGRYEYDQMIPVQIMPTSIWNKN